MSQPPNAAIRSRIPTMPWPGPAAARGVVPGARPGAVVGDVEADLVVVDGQVDRGPGARRVLDDVGERLLDDAVDRQLQRRGERAVGPGHVQVHRGARGPDGLDQLLDVDEPRGRRQGGRSVLLVAQQPEDDPQFFLGRSADGLDGFQGGAGLLRAPGHEAPADSGLDGDHREGVGHDVVQLAGDANTLLADLLAGAFGLGGSRPLGLLGQPGQVAPARRARCRR